MAWYHDRFRERTGISPKRGVRRQEKPARLKPEPAPLLTPDDLPCLHRGGHLETVACIPCQSRGNAGADVYACSLHGRCMIHNFAARDTKRNAVACVTCDDRLPAVEGE